MLIGDRVSEGVPVGTLGVVEDALWQVYQREADCQSRTHERGKTRIEHALME